MWVFATLRTLSASPSRSFNSAIFEVQKHPGHQGDAGDGASIVVNTPPMGPRSSRRNTTRNSCPPFWTKWRTGDVPGRPHPSAMSCLPRPSLTPSFLVPRGVPFNHDEATPSRAWSGRGTRRTLTTLHPDKHA